MILTVSCGGSGGVVVPYREAGGGSPGAVASNADDGALVYMAGANEAVMRSC